MNRYDTEAEKSAWFGPEVIFGLMYQYVAPGEKLLDLGIGTGLCAELFHKAGLSIFGIDNSKEMLAISQQKMPDAYLINHDLLVAPYPYSSYSFNHAVCTGVMNFFNDLSTVFSEASRVVQPAGFFGFIVLDEELGKCNEIKVSTKHAHSETTISMYRHSERYIEQLLKHNNFVLYRSLSFLIFMSGSQNASLQAKAYVAQKN